MISIFGTEWGKRTARGDIEQYVSGIKGVTKNWAIGHLKFVMRFSRVRKDYLFQIMNEIETSPIYSHLQTSECIIRLKNLRERIKKEL